MRVCFHMTAHVSCPAELLFSDVTVLPELCNELVEYNIIITDREWWPKLWKYQKTKTVINQNDPLGPVLSYALNQERVLSKQIVDTAVLQLRWIRLLQARGVSEVFWVQDCGAKHDWTISERRVCVCVTWLQVLTATVLTFISSYQEQIGTTALWYTAWNPEIPPPSKIIIDLVSLTIWLFVEQNLFIIVHLKLSLGTQQHHSAREWWLSCTTSHHMLQ